jgi:hypothetical protein
MEYDPATGRARQVAQLHQKGAQWAEIGDDGLVYVGECCQGGVERFNPKTDVLENFGPMDTNGGTYQYAYTLGADGRYVYVGLGQQPWYLGILDTQKKTKTLFWKNDHDIGGTVYRAKKGGWYYCRNTSLAKKWYRLEGGRPIEILPTEIPETFQSYEHDGVVTDPAKFASQFGIELDLDEAYPDRSRERAIIRWRQAKANQWQSVDVSGFNLQPIRVKRLYPWEGNQLLGFADFYGPVFLYDLTIRKATVMGRPKFSLYDALFAKGDIYFSGYPAVTLKYEPGRPWKVNDWGPAQSAATANPYKIPVGFGKYHYYSALGADGFVYIGAHHERNSTGGELGWYDPLKGTRGSLREPFLHDDVRDLKSALAGSKMVYSGNNEKLFVFDVATKQIERTIRPIPGIGALDKIVEVTPGIIFGATSNRIFKVDIRDGSVAYTKPLGGVAFGGAAVKAYDRRLEIGPDKHVWMFVGNSLCRIDPNDGSLVKVIDTPARSLLFKGGDLYFYGSTNLCRIQNVVARPDHSL